MVAPETFPTVAKTRTANTSNTLKFEIKSTCKPMLTKKSGAKILSLQPQIMEIFEKLKHEVVREVKKRNGTYEEFKSE